MGKSGQFFKSWKGSSSLERLTLVLLMFAMGMGAELVSVPKVYADYCKTRSCGYLTPLTVRQPYITGVYLSKSTGETIYNEDDKWSSYSIFGILGSVPRGASYSLKVDISTLPAADGGEGKNAKVAAWIDLYDRANCTFASTSPEFIGVSDSVFVAAGGKASFTFTVQIPADVELASELDPTRLRIMVWDPTTYTGSPNPCLVFSPTGNLFYGEPEDYELIIVDETSVELTSFTGAPSDKGALLEWETASEVDNAGFQLWRKLKGKTARATRTTPFEKVTAFPIGAKGGPSFGANYSYEDPGALPGNTYFYKLEDIDFQGKSTFHGPVRVTVPQK